MRACRSGLAYAALDADFARKRKMPPSPGTFHLPLILIRYMPPDVVIITWRRLTKITQAAPPARVSLEGRQCLPGVEDIS